MLQELDTQYLLVFLTCLTLAAALALVLIEAVRSRLALREHDSVRDRFNEEMKTLKDRAAEMETLMARISALQAQLDREKTEQISLELKVLKTADTGIRFIHEIGRPAAQAVEYTFGVRPTGDWRRQPPERMIFHPMIWRHVNEVRVWAPEHAAALSMVTSIFNNSTGLVIDLSDPPMGEDAAAEEEPILA